MHSVTATRDTMVLFMDRRTIERHVIRARMMSSVYLMENKVEAKLRARMTSRLGSQIELYGHLLKIVLRKKSERPPSLDDIPLRQLFQRHREKRGETVKKTSHKPPRVISLQSDRTKFSSVTKEAKITSTTTANTRIHFTSVIHPQRNKSPLSSSLRAQSAPIIFKQSPKQEPSADEETATRAYSRPASKQLAFSHTAAMELIRLERQLLGSQDTSNMLLRSLANVRRPRSTRELQKLSSCKSMTEMGDKKKETDNKLTITRAPINYYLHPSPPETIKQTQPANRKQSYISHKQSSANHRSSYLASRSLSTNQKRPRSQVTSERMERLLSEDFSLYGSDFDASNLDELLHDDVFDDHRDNIAELEQLTEASVPDPDDVTRQLDPSLVVRDSELRAVVRQLGQQREQLFNSRCDYIIDRTSDRRRWSEKKLSVHGRFIRQRVRPSMEDPVLSGSYSAARESKASAMRLGRYSTVLQTYTMPDMVAPFDRDTSEEALEDLEQRIGLFCATTSSAPGAGGTRSANGTRRGGAGVTMSMGPEGTMNVGAGVSSVLGAGGTSSGRAGVSIVRPMRRFTFNKAENVPYPGGTVLVKSRPTTASAKSCPATTNDQNQSSTYIKKMSEMRRKVNKEDLDHLNVNDGLGSDSDSIVSSEIVINEMFNVGLEKECGLQQLPVNKSSEERNIRSFNSSISGLEKECGLQQLPVNSSSEESTDKKSFSQMNPRENSLPPLGKSTNENDSVVRKLDPEVDKNFEISNKISLNPRTTTHEINPTTISNTLNEHDKLNKGISTADTKFDTDNIERAFSRRVVNRYVIPRSAYAFLCELDIQKDLGETGERNLGFVRSESSIIGGRKVSVKLC